MGLGGREGDLRMEVGWGRGWEENKDSQERNCAATIPNSYIHVSVSDLYIPLIGLPILLQENRWAERGNI
jgi:hypothetical protein